EACSYLLNKAINDNQAVHILETLWDINNAKDRQRWDANRAEEAQMARMAAEQEAEDQAQAECCILDEEEAVHVEEQKKNKYKFVPVHDYCELYFFTNDSLAEVESLSPSIDDKALTLLKSDMGQHVWVPASSTRDKSLVIKDEDLTWEQFGEAALCFINAMKENEWLDDRIQMHAAFWLALEALPWWCSPLDHLK
ncbi:hypothetical protein F5141DRAFT_1009263, partial [Pisolithus sp. B1]